MYNCELIIAAVSSDLQRSRLSTNVVVEKPVLWSKMMEAEQLTTILENARARRMGNAVHGVSAMVTETFVTGDGRKFRARSGRRVDEREVSRTHFHRAEEAPKLALRPGVELNRGTESI